MTDDPLRDVIATGLAVPVVAATGTESETAIVIATGDDDDSVSA